MGRYTVDFNEAEEYERTPEGEYEGTITEAKFREPRNAGKAPSISLTLEISDGENEGDKSWQNLYLSKKALRRTADILLIFEIDLSDAMDFDTDDPDQIDDEGNILDGPIADLIGEPVIFTVSHDTYKDKPSDTSTITEWLGETSTDDDDEPEEADEPDEDEEEEEAPPPKRKRQAAPARKKAAKPKRRALR